MKKKLFGIFIAAILLLTASVAFIVGCSGDNSAEKVTYSVTVLAPDETPQEGVTVSWYQGAQIKGNAVTGADGKATTELSASTYEVILDVEAGWTYTPITVGASLREPTVMLQRAQVSYLATVTDKTGAPASNVTVTWMKGTTIAGTAQTKENGQAACELDYGDYTVTIAGLPAGNVYEGGTPIATGASPSVRFGLTSGITRDYTVTVKSEGGLVFKNFSLLVYKGNTLVSTGKTDDEGVYTVTLAEGNYTVRASELDDGYTAEDVALTVTSESEQMTLQSKVISSAPANNTRYLIGSIIHDYTYTTPYEIDGSKKTLTFSEILKTKKAIIINNWGTKCSWCVKEMPAMNEAYLKYKNDIELIAVSNYQGISDRDADIYAEVYDNGYSFPAVGDTHGLAAKFGITAWPATVVIDRYGAVARIEAGAILDSDVWGRLIEKYIGDDYVQDFVPGDKESESITTEVARPDIKPAADHYIVMAQALNNTAAFPAGASVEYYGETEYEYAWPFVTGTVEGVSPDEAVVYAGGTGKANSMSVLYATVTVNAGKVFTFDYYSDTEDGEDVFSILWDGKIIREISGNSKGWKTCTLYADIADGSHTLAFVYIKDESKNVGNDNVYLRNVRFIELADITESTDMLRAAAYGSPEENAQTFPYYAGVELGDDGYYHVKLSELQNSSTAGNDESPMLFAYLTNATNWAGVSVRDIVYAVDATTGEYLFDLTLTVNGVTKDYRSVMITYLSTATNSDIAGFIPVDEELKEILVAFTSKLSGEESHDDEWLELCYFYSHYGSGEGVGNPIMGLTEKTAIEITLGTNTAELTRNMQPFPINIYSFTPSASGVYRIHSIIPEKFADEQMSQIWVYDDSTSIDSPLAYCGDTYYTRDGVDEHNFDVYIYLTAGQKYYFALAFQMQNSGTYDFTIERFGDSATILTPASQQFYWQILDDEGNFSGKVELADAVEYVKDNEGYYHAVNADGSMGGYIYLDVKGLLIIASNISLSDLVDKYVTDPGTYGKLDYKAFDFRYCVNYFIYQDNNGDSIVGYNPKYNLSTLDKKYTDYTDRIKEIIASAPTEGDEEGLVRVNQEIVDILTLFIELRCNSMYDLEIESALPNEWLRFCYYYKVYDENN